jgi:hypothetical protein
MPVSQGPRGDVVRGVVSWSGAGVLLSFAIGDVADDLYSLYICAYDSPVQAMATC